MFKGMVTTEIVYCEEADLKTFHPSICLKKIKRYSTFQQDQYKIMEASSYNKYKNSKVIIFPQFNLTEMMEFDSDRDKSHLKIYPGGDSE